jgi:integrase
MIHIKQVFDVLKEKAGLITNPFDDIPRMTVKDKPREVFSTEELLKMLDFTYENKGKLPLSGDYKLDQEILEAVFVIGFNTGMRRSDISLLKWEHVDFHKKAISKVMEKTQFSVFIPMTNGLYVFLKDKYAKRT